MEEIHRNFFPLDQKGIYCYTVWVRSIRDKFYHLCIDSCHEQIFCWREFWFSTFEMKYRLIQSPFNVHFMFPILSYIAEYSRIRSPLLYLFCYWHSCDLLVPDLFMHAAAVEFSVNTFIWTFARPFTKDFKTNKIAFRSSALICSFLSDVENKPPVDWNSIVSIT